ncbi:MAG: SDR family NAD(P)-dependent oxidoreductase [Verrucomicrobia bacterium]|nr:SDR family NAD(P)-dependent oxidoreductase [Verrucomicrobiota bacterium]
MSSLSEELTGYAAVIVTGGSSGIGKSFIKRVAKLHPGLLICNLSRSVPDINLCQLKLRHVPCDLSDQGALGAAVAEVLRLLNVEAPSGRVLLINNSGFGGYGRFAEVNLAHQLEMIDVNVRAVVELTGRLLPILKARGGAILTVASTAAFQPTPYLATYGATKAFVLHWNLALNEELRGSGVRALALCPGPTSTEFFRRAGLQQGSVSDSLGQTSEAVVEEALQALVRGRAQVVTGWTNKLMVAVSSKLSKPLATRIGAKILERYRLRKAAL